VDLDEDGQPPSRINRSRVNDRTIDEMLGLCRGILADGEVTTGEARFLYEWMCTNRHLATEWPATILFRRVREMLIDHALDHDEQVELFGLLDDIIGEKIDLKGMAVSASTSLPLDKPAPKIDFGGHRFCVTGRFVYGSRKQVVSQIEGRGGLIHDRASRLTNYVVIGVAASRDWIHSSYGRKIQDAVDLRNDGCPIRIVNELHWADAIAASPTDSTPAP
jgi:hypothetical protein